MRSTHRFLDKLGPGFITGSSDNDPAGIATYTQAGARFGPAMLWTAFFILPFLIAVQEMSARISMVTGTGITTLLRARYPKWLLWSFVSLLLIANIINIGADLGAMADAAHLLFPHIPFLALAFLFTCITLVLEIFITYKTYANILKWFALSLLSYIATAFIVTTDWRSVLTHVLIPTLALNRDFVLGLVAIFGTTISPYLFMWQTYEELEEKIANGRAARKLKDMRIETGIGMAFSQLITFFILTTATMTFFRHGLHSIQTTADAARALEPLAGRFAELLFAFGIIGTGLLAVPILAASASYALSGACNFSEGLSKKFREAHGFYGIIIFAMLVGLLMNFIGINPIQALLWSAVLNGLITPPLLALFIVIANNRNLMKKYANGWLSNLLCGTTLGIMTIAGILLFIL